MHVNSDGVALSIFILLSMLVSVVLIIMYNKWKLTKQLGVTMFTLYFVYVIEVRPFAHLASLHHSLGGAGAYSSWF